MYVCGGLAFGVGFTRLLDMRAKVASEAAP